MVIVRTLGTAAIDVGATRLTPASARKFAMFLYLWGERGRHVGRDTLHELIFPDQSAGNAKHSLRELVYQFRRAGARILSDSHGVELVADAARADYAEVLQQERASLDQLRAAAGGFLPGYTPTHSEAFTDWLEAFRAHATLELTRAFVHELHRARGVADWMVAEAAARAALALDPLHEEATLAMAELMALGGAKAKAVRLLDKYTEELGPGSPELKLPAALLRRRINERSRDVYRAPLTLPFLGRDAEMQALQERFARVKAGEAQCVVIVGEAGIGKTRLAEEMCAQAMLAGASVERVVTQPHDVHRPMATFADLVPKLLELPGALGCSPASMSALRRLTTSESEDGTAAAPGETAEMIAAAISRAIVDLVDSIASEAPLVVFVDDVQWADERSREMLSMLMSARVSRRFMVMLTSRDREVMQWFARRSEGVLAFSLAPLVPETLEELTRRVFLEQTTDDELRGWIASTSGGNPFFLRCLIGHFQATGERFVVPSNVSAFLDQRIAALSLDADAALTMCVALGRHAEVECVAAALELTYSRLQAAISELESAHLLALRDRRAEPAHWLVAEAASRRLSPIVSRMLHRRVAEVLEGMARQSRAPAELWDCAEHFVLAEERSRAVDLMRECSARSLEIGLVREAGEILLRAASLAPPREQPELVGQAIRIADDSGESDLLVRGWRLAESLRIRIDDEFARLSLVMAELCLLDKNDEAEDRVRKLFSDGDSPSLRIRAGFVAFVMSEMRGSPALADEARSSLAEIVADPQLADDPQAIVFSMAYHSSFGDAQKATSLARRLLELAARFPAARRATFQRQAALALFRSGKWEEAEETLVSAFANSRKAGLSRLPCIIASLLSVLYNDTGEDASALAWFDVAETYAREVPEVRRCLDFVSLKAERALLRGDVGEARAVIDEAEFSISPHNMTPRLHRWLRVFRAWIALLEGSARDCEQLAESLLADHRPNSELGDSSDAEVAVAVGLLYTSGNLTRAREAVATYIARFRRAGGPVSRALLRSMERVGVSHTTRAPKLVGYLPEGDGQDRRPANAALRPACRELES